MSYSPWEPLPGRDREAPSPPQRSGVFGHSVPRRRRLGRVFAQGVGLGLVATLLLPLLAVGLGLGIYAYYAVSLPSPHELYERTTPFKSTKIYDRRGHLLFEVFDPTGGRRTIVSIDEVPRRTIEAVIATEDETFYSNPGLNPFAILRALYRDIQAGEMVQGGSTITQQLVKNLYLTRERTLSRKIKEAILAAEITRRYSKNEILEIYLNEVYFGNLAYGLGAAAEIYYGKHVSQLTLAESALLAGMIQSPALYDPYTDPEAALARRATVLRLMRESGHVTWAEMEDARKEPLGLVPKAVVMEAPHMVMLVREQLERRYGTEVLYRGGLQVYTTLDLELQHAAEEIAREHIDRLAPLDATNAALVALDPRTGDILAMLGSVDFYDQQIDGQVNVARRLRQPGSTIKTFTYLAAMERGWTPATMIMDVAQDFPDGANRPYRPENYDHEEMGPVSLRAALACSRNIPAVSTLYQIGLPALLEVCHRLGMASLDRPDYGLSLTLGGGDVTLLELTGAYAALANGGHRVVPRTILRIQDQTGHELLTESTAPEMEQVIDPRHAYLLTHILSDNEARAPAFGADSPLQLSLPAAAKTGTTDDYRDSWTVGYTPDLVAGVWVGNNDNSPMRGVSGSKGAGPIWHDFIERALASRVPIDFPVPGGLVTMDVCPISGQKHTSHCPDARQALFLVEHTPPECGVHRIVSICSTTGKLATDLCPGVQEKRVEDYGPAWDAWALEQGIEAPPREQCSLHTRPAQVEVHVAAEVVSGVVPVSGVTDVPGFGHYVIEYARVDASEAWRRITPPITSPVYGGTLCNWDTTRLRPGVYSLRLVVADHDGNNYQAVTSVEVRTLPMPTSTPEFISRPTITGTPLIRPTAKRPVPSPTSILPTMAPTATLGPTMTPTASPTPLPTSTRTRMPRDVTAEATFEGTPRTWSTSTLIIPYPLSPTATGTSPPYP